MSTYNGNRVDLKEFFSFIFEKKGAPPHQDCSPFIVNRFLSSSKDLIHFASWIDKYSFTLKDNTWFKSAYYFLLSKAPVPRLTYPKAQALKLTEKEEQTLALHGMSKKDLQKNYGMLQLLRSKEL